MPKDNIPEIRVAGFSEVQWSKKKCEDLLTERNVQHPQSEEYPLVSFTIEDGVTPKTERYERESLVAGDKNAKKYKETRLNDIVYNPANLKFGAIARNKYGNAVFSPIYVTFDVNENFAVPEFVEVLVSKKDFIQDALQYQKGTVYERMSVCSTDFLNLDVKIPSVAEQRQIGSIFERLDALISQHQHKHEALVAVKKAMLEKMFPKEGENVPEIRFVGFTDPWEQRKLGDCFTERVESMPDGELISVTINDGIKKFSELGRHDNSNDDKSKYKKVCVGDIAYNSMRMWQGASGYSPYEGIVSPAYTVLSPNSGINSKCLAYQFKLPEIIHTFQVNSQGITSDNWNLKYPALSQIEIFVSKDEQEQAKIAKYFENLDNLITLHQRKCEVLKNLKSALPHCSARCLYKFIVF